MGSMSRQQWITEEVCAYLAHCTDRSSGEYIGNIARTIAGRGGVQALRAWAVDLIQTQPSAHHLRTELAANDYDRIDWAAITHELGLE